MIFPEILLPARARFAAIMVPVCLAATLLACIAHFPVAAAAVPADDAPLGLMFTAPKGDNASRGFLAVMVAAYSKRPGLVLLEGAESDRIQAEIDLSKSGLVDPDSLVRDRRIKPDVKVEVRLVGVVKKPLVRLEGTVTGPAGTGTFAVTVDPGNQEALLAAFDEPIARVLPKEQRKLFLRGCLNEGWTLTDLEGKACVDEIKARCAGEGTPRHVLVCMGMRGAEVRKLVRAFKDDAMDMTPKEMAVALKARDDPRGSFTQQEQGLLTAMIQRSQARKEARTRALDEFRQNLVDAMNVIAKAGDFQIVVSEEKLDTFWLHDARVTGVRWSAHEASPSFMYTVLFHSSDRNWTRDDFGTVRKFVDRLRSFGLKGTSADGEVFDVRLLIGDEHRARGAVDTVMSTDYFARYPSLIPYKPDYRTEKVE
jgi:hypothetical protein